MTDGIPLIHADDRIGASGMQPKSPFAPPPPPIVPPSDGIGLQAAAGRKPLAMRAVPSHDQLADKVSKWEISVEIFPELPAVAAQISRDVDVLESLAEGAKPNKLMGPLVEAQEAIQEKISDFDNDAFTSGFGAKSRGLTKRLHDAFSDAAVRTAGTGLADMPWMVVRGLAIDLNNKQDSPEGACSILEGLISHKGTTPSKAVVDKLRDDLRTLRRNLKWEELKRVSGDVPKGTSLVSELLEGADPDERAVLLRLKRGLTQKRNTIVGKWAFWAYGPPGQFAEEAWTAPKSPASLARCHRTGEPSGAQRDSIPRNRYRSPSIHVKPSLEHPEVASAPVTMIATTVLFIQVAANCPMIVAPLMCRS